jgi:hypothetical protein
MKIKFKKMNQLKDYQQPDRNRQGHQPRKYVNPSSIHLPEIKKLAQSGVPVVVYDDLLNSALFESYVRFYNEQ